MVAFMNRSPQPAFHLVCDTLCYNRLKCDELTLVEYTDNVMYGSFRSDEKRIASNSDNRTMKIWWISRLTAGEEN